jgi:hypothetical protein
MTAASVIERDLRYRQPASVEPFGIEPIVRPAA